MLVVATRCVYPVRYKLGDALEVEGGLFICYSVSLESILSAEPKRFLASSTAPSIDRILIRYSHGSSGRVVYVFPKNQEMFLNDLARVSSNP